MTASLWKALFLEANTAISASFVHVVSACGFALRQETDALTGFPLAIQGGVDLILVNVNILNQRLVRHYGKPVSLTGTEFELLELMMRSAGRVISRDEMAIALH